MSIGCYRSDCHRFQLRVLGMRSCKRASGRGVSRRFRDAARPPGPGRRRMLDAGQRVGKTRLNPQEPSAHQSWRLNHFSGQPRLASSREGGAAPSDHAGPAAKARWSNRYRPRFLQPVKPTDTEQQGNHRLSLRHLFRTLPAHTDAVPSRSQSSGYSTCLRPPLTGQVILDSSAPVAQLLGAIDRRGEAVFANEVQGVLRMTSGRANCPPVILPGSTRKEKGWLHRASTVATGYPGGDAVRPQVSGSRAGCRIVLRTPPSAPP